MTRDALQSLMSSSSLTSRSKKFSMARSPLRRYGTLPSSRESAHNLNFGNANTLWTSCESWQMNMAVKCALLGSIQSEKSFSRRLLESDLCHNSSSTSMESGTSKWWCKCCTTTSKTSLSLITCFLRKFTSSLRHRLFSIQSHWNWSMFTTTFGGNGSIDIVIVCQTSFGTRSCTTERTCTRHFTLTWAISSSFTQFSKWTMCARF